MNSDIEVISFPETSLPVPPLDKGNEGSGNEVGHRTEVQ